MKTAWTLLLCLCLALSMVGGLAEAIRIDQPPPDIEEAAETNEADEEAPDNWDEFFRSMEGRISFTLPRVPEVIREADLTDDDIGRIGWTDKLQLMTYTMDGAEFFVHIADLAPSIRKLRWEYPGQDDFNYRMNALVNMATFYLDLYDGSIVGTPDAVMLQVENEEYPELRFSYTYPDSPGIEFRARGIMDGDRAVLIMAEVDDDSLRILEDLHVATQAEADAFRNRPPETVTMGDMRITFPVPTDNQCDDVSDFYDAFTPGYAYLTAEYMEFPFWMLVEDGETADQALENLARQYVEGLEDDGELESSSVEQVAEGVWRFGGLSPMEEYMTGPQERIVGYVTLNGVYMIHSVETDEGRAFLDSIVIDAPAE